MRVTRLAAAALVMAGAAGCRQKEAQGAIPRERFVAANIALRSVPDTVRNGDSLRTAALRKYRVTERDLLRFVRVHSRNPEYLQKVWAEVSDSLQKRYDREMTGSHDGGPGHPDAPTPDMAEGRPNPPGRPGAVVRPPARPPVVTPSGEPTPVPPPPQPQVRPAVRPAKRVEPAPAGQAPPERTPSPPTDRGPMRPAQPTIQRPATQTPATTPPATPPVPPRTAP